MLRPPSQQPRQRRRIGSYLSAIAAYDWLSDDHPEEQNQAHNCGPADHGRHREDQGGDAPFQRFVG
jgi:hypothetical protein